MMMRHPGSQAARSASPKSAQSNDPPGNPSGSQLPRRERVDWAQASPEFLGNRQSGGRPGAPPRVFREAWKEALELASDSSRAGVAWTTARHHGEKGAGLVCTLALRTP